MTDYDRIAKAIRYIEEHVGEQPNLDQVAAHVHLSPFHFQRIFSRWAGVTPKRFLQVLTLERAKMLLKVHDMSVLDVCYETGLSSGSRLYDHFVQIEAVTPSEFKSAGVGLTLLYGIASTPFGAAFIAVTTKGICKFSFVDEESMSDRLHILQSEWPQAELIEDQPEIASIVDKMFYQDASAAKPLSLLVRGTNFQVSVWQALLSIPPGKVTSYGDIARAIGKPKAARAVGTAIGSNPIAFMIPCHRVIQKTGDLGGYRWGEIRKHAMLTRESAIYDS
ncbi:bifunctional transcriptional activator/DNA repair enzyme AdaA [Motiliproteus sp. MSK22-1]|uniref:bifunctional transcriptional activator/DNA repair enzyme AdaA n=1 Tax=Motiliproteus sp. MSK22-1 TaxID=1897630 RepID=UPI000975ADDC|nr:methylated-DNA--[protein]-cysteine S-methyltransferase [Motiliproteus sp. MSK22-1]OMH27121.1 6-O-methylguanine DNA methyltransferase [Motiliproteus sp. MSK22-1]